jgi:hypothetical protein
VSGFVETKFDPVNNSLIVDVDKTLTGGKGVGDIRSGEEMATFNVNYNINPNIQLKPLKGDDGKDPIKDADGNYVFGKGDNGKYQLVFTDEKGEEHVVETEAFPFTITDGSGTTYEVTLTESNRVDVLYVNEMAQSDNTRQPVDTVKVAQQVKDLVVILQERIKDKLKNSEGLLKQAYDNVEVLSQITYFEPMLGSGGQYRNGKLYIGTRNFTKNSPDEDILATIFHEYMHYLNWLDPTRRYRMESMKDGVVYAITIPCYEKKTPSNDYFLEQMYQLYITNLLNSTDTLDRIKYSNYEDLIYYKDLNISQKKEVDEYIAMNNLSPVEECVPYYYSPSNFFQDEINAHSETLNADSLGTLKMSDAKKIFYKNEISRYTEGYNKARTYEFNNNVNSYGPEQ